MAVEIDEQDFREILEELLEEPYDRRCVHVARKLMDKVQGDWREKGRWIRDSL